MQVININWANHLVDELRYEADCTLATAHGGVITPWNSITIPRPYALPCTVASAHSTPSNRGF
jgi:hypothetical protein